MTIKLLERREYGAAMLKDLSMGTDENVGQAIRKGMVPLEVKAAGDNIIRFIVSNGSLDRDHDTINVNGWDLENYKKNPVVLWAHEHHSVPIAKGNDIRVENNNLIADAEFMGPDIMQFSNMLYQMYKGGFMSAVSVGFMPDERVWSEEQGGIRFLSQEMLEFSAVPVPANPEALMLAAKGGIDVAPMKAWAENLLEEWQEGNRPVGASRKSIERMLKIADDKKPAVSIPAFDPDKQKEIRQRNIWEPRLKEFRRTKSWNVTDWGESNDGDRIKAPEDVPDYLWVEHLATEEEERTAQVEARKAAKDAEDLRVSDWIKARGELSPTMTAIADALTSEKMWTLEGFVEQIGTDAIDAIDKALSEHNKPNPYLTDEYKAKLEAIGKIEPEEIEAVRELLTAKGFSRMDDASIKDMIVELEVETVESQSKAIEVKELTKKVDQLTKERDVAMMATEEFAASLKESQHRVDPAEMVKLFGATLAKSIQRITGRLPNDND